MCSNTTVCLPFLKQGKVLSRFLPSQSLESRLSTFTSQDFLRDTIQTVLDISMLESIPMRSQAGSLGL